MAVFISYASKDAAVATSLVAALERSGVSCWIAPRDVKPGTLYAEAIIRAISGAKVMVLVLSDSAIASSHVGKEIERASSKRIPIIALRTDSAPLTPAFEYFLSESQWVDASGGSAEVHYARLAEAVLDAERSDPQWSPGAVRPGADSALQSPTSRRRKRTGVVVVGAVIAVALVVGGWWAFRESKSAPPTPPEPQAPVAAASSAVAAPAAVVSDKSIAVLPFADMSEKKDQGYFSDGLSEDLINLLTKVPQLQVPARASSFYFQGQHVTIAEIAKALNVAYVLEGSVSKSGNTVRVRTELIRAANGYDVWSDSYDRELKDIFKVQDDIAGQVVTALRAALPATALAHDGHTVNTEAYNQELLGRAFQLHEDEPGWRQAREAYKKAIALDPNYVDAYVGLGYTESRLADATGDPAGIARASAAAQRAIDLAPDAAAGYGSRAFIRVFYLWDWAGARNDIARAVAIEPNGNIDAIEAVMLEADGRLSEAVPLLRKRALRDPLAPSNWMLLATALSDGGQFSESDSMLQRALAINPNFDIAHQLLIRNQLLTGHPEQALALTHDHMARQDELMWTAMTQYSLHHAAESQQELDELIRTNASSMAYQIAQVYAWRHESELAFKWLDRAFVQRDAGLLQIKSDRFLTPLRTDPRFVALLRKMQLPV